MMKNSSSMCAMVVWSISDGLTGTNRERVWLALAKTKCCSYARYSVSLYCTVSYVPKTAHPSARSDNANIVHSLALCVCVCPCMVTEC